MLCADDFAMSNGIDRGILDLFEKGRLTATTAIVTGAGWKAAARHLVPLRGRFDLGLHINLTFARPLGDMPRFARGGIFPSVDQVLKGALLGLLPLDEIRAEIARQFDAFEDAMGASPDFVDGHQHIQMLPRLNGAFVDEIARRYPRAGVYLRDSSDQPGRIIARRLEAPQALGLSLVGMGAAARARRAGIPVNDGVSGFSNFDPRRDFAVDFRCFLAAPGPRQLVFCHPGLSDADPLAADGVRTREVEYNFLSSSRFIEILDEARAKLAFWNEFAHD